MQKIDCSIINCYLIFSFFNFYTAADLKSALQNLKIKLREAGQPLQPLIVSIGELTNVHQYMVVINEELYEKKTCFDAIDLAFKVFFAFDCEYPENSLTLWLFVQKCLFGLNLETDINNISLNIIIGSHTETLKRKS